MAKYPDVTAGQTEACINRFGGWDNFLRFIGGQGEVVWKKFLHLVTTVEMPAQPRFVARDHFKVDTSSSARVKVAFIWEGFSTNFLYKVEEAVEATTLAVHKLEKNLLDKEIRAELGENKEETTLSQFWALLEKQGHGQEGDLLVNGYANIFYIRDTQGRLWAVYTYWRAGRGGWRVGADSVSRPDRWYAGRQVVSRN